MTNKKVAIKTIDKTKINNYGMINWIFNEVEILSKCDHSNIIKLYEIFGNKNFYFLVTEYVE